MLQLFNLYPQINTFEIKKNVGYCAGKIYLYMCSRCEPLFVQLWAQFGGNFWDHDIKGQLAVELRDNPHRDILLQFMGEFNV